MSEITLTEKTLSRIVDRLAETLRNRPEASKSSLLNVVAAEIAGPGHDWGLIKNADRIASRDAPQKAALPDLPALDYGPVLVGTHFGINDLPGKAFDWNAEAAEDFLSVISGGLRDAMISAGTQYIELRMSMDLNVPEDDEEDEDYDTFDHPAYQERQVRVMRLSDGTWWDHKPGWMKTPDQWQSDPEKATLFQATDVMNMAVPEGCVIVPFAVAQPEPEPEVNEDPQP